MRDDAEWTCVQLRCVTFSGQHGTDLLADKPHGAALCAAMPGMQNRGACRAADNGRHENAPGSTQQALLPLDSLSEPCPNPMHAPGRPTRAAARRRASARQLAHATRRAAPRAARPGRSRTPWHQTLAPPPRLPTALASRCGPTRRQSLVRLQVERAPARPPYQARPAQPLALTLAPGPTSRAPSAPTHRPLRSPPLPMQKPCPYRCPTQGVDVGRRQRQPQPRAYPCWTAWPRPGRWWRGCRVARRLELAGSQGS